jgi:hypothetical protein
MIMAILGWFVYRNWIQRAVERLARGAIVAFTLHSTDWVTTKTANRAPT